jgi:hypothetical protein
MMIVRDLIRQLRDMPQDVEVFMTAHDNTEWEVQSSVNVVYHYRKSLFVCLSLNEEDSERFETLPDEWITLSP